MKPRTIEDGALYEEGFFVFELDTPPTRPFVVKCDGVVVPMDPDGRYRLRKAPTSIEVECCAGPFYAPPLAWLLGKTAVRDVRRRLLEAHVRNAPMTEEEFRAAWEAETEA